MKVKCPICEGEGYFEEYIDHWLADKYDCTYCKGAGSVSIFKRLSLYFWERMPDWLWDFWYELFHKEESEE